MRKFLVALAVVLVCGGFAPSAGAKPTLLIFHPGAFVFGRGMPMTAAKQVASRHGFRPVNVEYLPRSVEDPHDLIRVDLRRSLREARDRGGKVYAYGESAGGNLAGVLAKRGLVRAAAVYEPATNLMHQDWSEQVGTPYWRRRASLNRGPTTSPILAIASRDDQVVGFRDTARWARRISNVRLGVKPGGHLDQADCPQALRRAMRYLGRKAER